VLTRQRCGRNLLGRCVVTAGRQPSDKYRIRFTTAANQWFSRLGTDRIASTSRPKPKTRQQRPKLQSFMTDRFKLTLHREIKEMPITVTYGEIEGACYMASQLSYNRVVVEVLSKRRPT
jgi:hypothetical protein